MIRKTIIAAALLAAMTTASLAASGWTTGSVNFRDGPGASYAKLGSIARCVQVEIGETQNGWYRINWNGRWGWVAARYITSDSSYCSSGGGYTAPKAY